MSGIAANQRTRRDSLKHNAARRNNGAGTNFYPGTNKSSRRDPAPAADGDWRHLQFEIFLSKIVAACAKIGPLANAHVTFNGHRGQTQDADIVTNPNVVSDIDSPRERDVHVRTNDHAAPDPRSEH